MTLTKIDQAPVIKRIRVAMPYLVHEETKQIYSHYSVIVKWADGTRKEFDTEEQAHAFIEKRTVNQATMQAEVPEGYTRALEIHNSYLIHEEEEKKPEEKQSDFDVYLVSIADDKKISVIKAIRQITGVGLRESKELATSLPARIVEAFESEAAEKVKHRLEEAGGTIELR